MYENDINRRLTQCDTTEITNNEYGKTYFKNNEDTKRITVAGIELQTKAFKMQTLRNLSPEDNEMNEDNKTEITIKRLKAVNKEKDGTIQIMMKKIFNRRYIYIYTRLRLGS